LSNLLVVFVNILHNVQDAIFIMIAAYEFRMGMKGFIAVAHGHTMADFLEHGQVIELVTDCTNIGWADTK
jgi:hypothetical protein